MAKVKKHDLPRPEGIARIYAEVRRDEALRRYQLLAQEGKRKEANVAKREASRQDLLVKELRAREERVQAEHERDRLARLGIELAEAGRIQEARGVAARAERWNAVVKRLAKKWRWNAGKG